MMHAVDTGGNKIMGLTRLHCSLSAVITFVTWNFCTYRLSAMRCTQMGTICHKVGCTRFNRAMANSVFVAHDSCFQRSPHIDKAAASVKSKTAQRLHNMFLQRSSPTLGLTGRDISDCLR